jgi:hypothetical protein
MNFQLASRAVLFFGLSAGILVAQAQDGALERLKKDLTELAGPKMEGRGNGQKGLDKAIAYVVASYKKMGIQAQIQPFPYRLRNSQTPVGEFDGHLSNVVAVIKGKDEKLSSEYIVVGAHLDHLGVRAPAGGGQSAIYFGADDNASGSAALLELARAYQKNPPSRSLIFIHFAGEEWGLLGSRYWVTNPTVGIDSVRFMANIDMIGRLDPSTGTMTFNGVGMGPEDLAKATALAPIGLNIEADRGTSPFSGSSDHAPFAASNIPTCNFFTGIHPDYHRPGDTLDKINWSGFATITQYAKTLITEYATTANVPVFQPRGNLGLFTAPGAEKPIAARITQGGCAELAGLESGDLLIYINGDKINSPKDLAEVLDAMNRGDAVRLVWERNGVRMYGESVLN